VVLPGAGQLVSSSMVPVAGSGGTAGVTIVVTCDRVSLSSKLSSVQVEVISQLPLDGWHCRPVAPLTEVTVAVGQV
jgi:hypothetical protein